MSAAVTGLVAGLSACHGDFLSGGELSVDPNRPTAASNSQLFVGIQSNIFYFEVGDLTRIASLFSQHLSGLDRYIPYDQYMITEATTNGAQRALYGPGGLADVRRLEAGTSAVKDSVFTGMAQVQEAMLMAFNADAFGDVVYTEALGPANPKLDKQLVVFDSIQALLDRAIVNLAASGPTNVGPRGADLVYHGDPTKWTELAHSLKARYYLHTAELPTVSATAYANAASEAALGISTPANDYTGIYSGNANETNPWSIIAGPSGRGLLAVNPWFADTLLVARNDPRRTAYFTVDPVTLKATSLSATRVGKSFPQPIVTYAENLLIWAEAAYRGGDEPTALQKLDAERALVGLPAELPTLSGSALLQEILTEKYIVDFQLGLEGWKDYRRTCFPNLPNRSQLAGASAVLPMPGRFYYDKDDRLTNTSIPVPGIDPNGIRNQVDPANATADAVGGACLAGA